MLIAPDGKIIDANMAAESFFEISTQFLQRQSLKELVPFGSPLLALIDQVRNAEGGGSETTGGGGGGGGLSAPNIDSV